MCFCVAIANILCLPSLMEEMLISLAVHPSSFILNNDEASLHVQRQTPIQASPSVIMTLPIESRMPLVQDIRS